MKKALTNFLGIAFSIVAMNGCGGPDSTTTPAANDVTPTVATYPPDGMQCTAILDPSGTIPTVVPKALAAHCAMCHGPAGHGGNGYPDIHLMITFDQFSGIVRNGKGGSLGIMPPFSTAQVDDDDLRRIYAFLTMSPLVETHQCHPAM